MSERQFLKCSHCNGLSSFGAKFCGKCGKPLDAGTINEPSSDPKNKTLHPTDYVVPQKLSVESTMSKVNERIADMESRIKQRLGKHPSSEQETHGPVVHQKEIENLLYAQPEELKQAAAYIFQNGYVQKYTNAKIMGLEHFIYLETPQQDTGPQPDDINAAAFWTPVENGALKPRIIFCRGLATAHCLVSTAMAIYFGTRNFDVLHGIFGHLGEIIVRGKGLPLSDAEEIFKNKLADTVVHLLQEHQARFISHAQSFRFSMYLWVIAHEMGHISHDHAKHAGENLDIIRNHERDADNFASSVLSTCPYREYHFLGQMLALALFVWVDHLASNDKPSTHPLARERFENTFASNSQAAKDAEQDFGLSKVKLLELLP